VALQHVVLPEEMSFAEARRHLVVLTDAPGHFVEGGDQILRSAPPPARVQV